MRVRGILIALLAPVAIGVLWFVTPSGRSASQRPDPPAGERSRPQGSGDSVPVSPASPPAEPSDFPTPLAALPPTTDSERDPAAPHPTSPARDALLDGRRRVEELDIALKKSDWAGATRALEEFAQLYEGSPTWQHHIEGYRILLDCMRFSDARARQAGATFVREFSGSPLRRKVRRACAPP